MNSVQCKLARVALGWSVIALAQFSNVSTNTIVRFESGEKLRSQTYFRIKLAFEASGIAFVVDDQQGFGIYIKKASALAAASHSGDMKTITSAQVRAARSLIRWSADELAAAARVGVATVRRAEREHGQPSTTVAILAALRTTLETAGIEFIFDDGEGVGVRFRRL